MKAQKIISIVLWISFLLIAGYFSFDEYKHHIDISLGSEYQIEEKIEWMAWFSINSIQNFESIQVYKTPDLEFLDFLVSQLDDAEKSIYLNVYIFTEKRMREALIRAQKKWVQVKVILEKNVYLAPNLNNTTFEQLQNAWIQVVWSNPKNFSLNHAKYIIIDGKKVFVWTGNFSYTTFKSNTDFFVKIDDNGFVSQMSELFESDFSGEKKFFFTSSSLFSSYDAREKLEHLFESSEQTIDMYVPYFIDQSLLDIVQRKIHDGVKIRMIVDSDVDDMEIENFKHIWIEVQQKSNIHAKIALFDQKVLYLWSTNYSQSSIDENREVWVLISNQEIIWVFTEYF